MNRRGFLKFLAGTAAVATAAVVLPEEIAELLAPRRTIFLPPRQTTYAAFIPELWSREIVEAYKKNIVVSNLLYRRLRADMVYGSGVLYVPNRKIHVPYRELRWT